MKKFIKVLLVSFALATVIVLVALYFRQDPKRSGTDAYLPIRTLIPIEAAVLLSNEENRDPETLIHTSVEKIDGSSLTILTTIYVIERPKDSKRVAEQIGDINYRGKDYSLISNSWENYCCRYRLNKAKLEEILGKPIEITPIAAIDNSRLQSKNVSFSSDKIAFYIIVEVVVITLILLALFYLFTKVHFLLWLPGLFFIEFLLFFGVMIYSPALYDADWFHQRIILEEITLNAPLFNINLLLALYATILSVLSYAVWRLGRVLDRKGFLPFKHYLCLIGGILGTILIAFLIITYRQYQSLSADANKLIVSIRSALSTEIVRSILVDPALPETKRYLNFFKEEVLQAKTMNLINKILDSRSSGEFDLRVLIPVSNHYLYLSRNDSYEYADLRTLGSYRNGITDYEFIQPAISLKRSYQTPFWLYALKTIMLEYKENKFIAVEIVLGEQGDLSSVIVVEPDFRN